MKTNLKRNGLTLLELLLVVFILSLIALSAVAIADRADEQFRYDETVAKLEQIRTAILGDGYGSKTQPVFSGFVADMGRLPDSMCELVVGVTSDPIPQPLASSQLQPLYFVPSKSNDIQTQAESVSTSVTKLNLARLQVIKGFRGPYLHLGPQQVLSSPPTDIRENQQFRDGWGNVGPSTLPQVNSPNDLVNHGWFADAEIDPTTNQIIELELRSHGADGFHDSVVTPQTDFERDVNEEILSSDWGVEITTLRFQVENNSTDITGSTLDLRLSLLVYVGGTWHRFLSDSTTARVTDFANGDLHSFEFTSSLPHLKYIPQGQHIAVMVDQNASPVPGDLVPLPTDTTKAIGWHINILPRTTPTYNLIIQ